MKQAVGLLFGWLALLALTACVQQDNEPPVSRPTDAGFLTDYTLLEPAGWEGTVKQVYVDPQLAETIASYSGVMVDQPEVFVSPQSPYRGVKPDGLKKIADQMRFLLIGEMLRGGYNVVETPGEDIVYLRAALTGLKLEKVRGSKAYLPIAETDESELAAVRGLMQSLNIVAVNVELELVDSVTDQVIIAGVAKDVYAEDAADPMASWRSLGQLLEGLSAGMSCLVNKANIPADARLDICRGVAAR